MDPIKTGRIIAEMRKANGLTQLALAKQLGVSDKAVSKWERGLSFPDITVLIPLSEILGVSLNDLLKGEHMDTKTDSTTTKTSESQTNSDLLKDTITHYSAAAKAKSKQDRLRGAIPWIVIIVVSLAIAVISPIMEAKNFVNSELKQINDYVADFEDWGEDEAFRQEYPILLPIFELTGTPPFQTVIDYEETVGNEAYATVRSTFDKSAKLYGGDTNLKKIMAFNALDMFIKTDRDAINFNFKDQSIRITRENFAMSLGIDNCEALQDYEIFDEVKAKLLSSSSVDTIFAKAVE